MKIWDNVSFQEDQGLPKCVATLTGHTGPIIAMNQRDALLVQNFILNSPFNDRDRPSNLFPFKASCAKDRMTMLWSLETRQRMEFFHSDVPGECTPRFLADCCLRYLDVISPPWFGCRRHARYDGTIGGSRNREQHSSVG